MPDGSVICTCGDAIRIHDSGRRVTLFTGLPHLDHTAYEPWAARHGLVLDRLGWLPEVINWPRGIRDQIVSPRLLVAVGLVPGIDWDQFGPTSGALITTAGQQPHYSGFETVADENDPQTDPKEPLEPAETPQEAQNDPIPTPSAPDPVHQPEVARRFGAEDETRTPGRTAAGRWGG